MKESSAARLDEVTSDEIASGRHVGRSSPDRASVTSLRPYRAPVLQGYAEELRLDERHAFTSASSQHVAVQPTEAILGYSVYAGAAAQCTEAIAAWLEHGDKARWLACLNPHSYAVALEKPEFQAALKDADWLIPDGVGVVYASRALGGQICDRITGFDVFHGVNEALDKRGEGRVFFIGSTQDTLERIREKMAVDYPGVRVVGTYSPPFKPEYSDSEVDEMVDAINAARPDVLWVGMTAPKQETWIQRVRDRVDVRFAAAIGAVFDFYVGKVQRSPPVFQRLGLEWLPRLVQEPRRLWRRTFVSAPVFVWAVARERVLRD